MRHKRAFNLIAIFCLTALPFGLGFAQTTSSRHTAKKSAHQPQHDNIASSRPPAANALAQPETSAQRYAGQTAAHAQEKQVAAESVEIGDAEKNELYDKELELGKAEETKQAAFFQQNLAPNFMYVAFNGLVLSRDEILRALSHLQVSNSEIRNVRFRRLDHNVIQLAYDLFVNGDIFGQAIPHQQYATSIWIKDAGDWRLAYHQTTPAHHR